MPEYERAKILERSRRGKRHAARTGVVSVLSGAPYGYRYLTRQDGGGQARYAVVLEEARVVRQVFEWVGRERLSLREVCRRLQQAAVPTRTGKPVWERTTVWAMLKNPAYVGRAAFGKTRAGPLRPRLRAMRGHDLQPRRASSTYDVAPTEWLAVPVPALVPPALFDTVQDQLRENRRRAREGHRGARYLLQGLVSCTQCGYAYYGKAISPSAAKGHPRHYAYYRCIGSDAYRFGGQRRCANRQVRTDVLDAAVWYEVRALLEQPQRLAAAYQRRLQAPAPGRPRAELAIVEAQLRKARQGISRLIDSYAEGVIDTPDFEPRITGLKDRVAKLEAQAQVLGNEAALQSELRLIIGHLEEFAASITSRLDEVTWSTQRTLIRTLVQRVEIDRGQVHVVFRIEPGPVVPRPDGAVLQDCGWGSFPRPVQHVPGPVRPVR